MLFVSPEFEMHRKTAGMAVLCLVFSLLAAVASAADVPEIHVAIGAEEIFAGESVDYQVEIRNAKDPVAPDLSAIGESFEIVSAGNESRDQSSISIINGRMSKQSILSHVYLYRLTPKSPGEQLIPAASATVDGKALTSREIPLRVIAAEKQDLVIVETESSHDRVYPTQPFSISLRVLIQPLPNNAKQEPLAPLRQLPPHLQVNWVDLPAGLVADDNSSQWLQSMVAEDGIGFTLNEVNTRSGSLFDGPRPAVFNLLKGRETRDGLDGNSVRYYVYELKRTLIPERTGTYSLGPAIVKGTFVAGFERREYTPRRLVATAPAVTVEVREIPSPRPPTFCGGIGEYKIAATASPSGLRVGDPLTLTLEFERGAQSGSLELISAPDLSAIQQLTDDFDLIDRNPTGRIEGTTKKFAYALRPKRPNVSLPSLQVSTFDPRSEEFLAINTKAIPLEVSEAERLTSGDLIGTRSANSAASIKTQSHGIYQNITDPRELRDQRVNLVTCAVSVFCVWFVAGGLAAGTNWYRRKRSDPDYMRRQQARGIANRRLAESKRLAKEGKPAEAFREVRASIVGFVADLRGHVAEGLTTAEIDAILSTSQIPETERTAVLQLLEQIESAEFGGGQFTNPSTAIETANRLLSRIAPGLERGTKQ